MNTEYLKQEHKTDRQRYIASDIERHGCDSICTGEVILAVLKRPSWDKCRSAIVEVVVTDVTLTTFTVAGNAEGIGDFKVTYSKASLSPIQRNNQPFPAQCHLSIAQRITERFSDPVVLISHSVEALAVAQKWVDRYNEDHDSHVQREKERREEELGYLRANTTHIDLVREQLDWAAEGIASACGKDVAEIQEIIRDALLARNILNDDPELKPSTPA